MRGSNSFIIEMEKDSVLDYKEGKESMMVKGERIIIPKMKSKKKNKNKKKKRPEPPPPPPRP